MTDHEIPRLALWRDLTPLPAPLKRPTPTSPRILVVGGGVTGLITSWILLDKGYHVTIVSAAWADSTTTSGQGARITSQIAGALWEYPPAVCGSHTDAISLSRSKNWCMTAYHIWDGLAKYNAAESGVRMMPSGFYFPCRIEEDAAQLEKMYEIIASGVKGFRRDGEGLVGERRVSSQYGVRDAYEFLAPIIDTDKAMSWLMKIVDDKGATRVTRKVVGDLLELEDELLELFGASAIVNATGLSGDVLAGDTSCYPIRGALIRVRNTGEHFPKVEAALTITADAVHDANSIVFLVPRNDEILLIGGIAEPHETELNLTLDSPVVKRMRQRCERFLPCLESAQVDTSYPLAQGLRPFRRTNLRVEREGRVARSRIVHSYGQGGAGWSLSFGCAQDAVALVEQVLSESKRPAVLHASEGDTVRARL